MNYSSSETWLVSHTDGSGSLYVLGTMGGGMAALDGRLRSFGMGGLGEPVAEYGGGGGAPSRRWFGGEGLTLYGGGAGSPVEWVWLEMGGRTGTPRPILPC